MPKPPRTSHQLNLLQLNISVFLFGFTGLFGKWLSVHPLVIVFGRVTFGFLALLLWAVLSKQVVTLKSRRHFGTLLLLALLFIVHWGTFFASIQVSSVAVCLISFSTAPITTVLFEPLFFAQQKLKSKDVWVALVVTMGVAIATPSLSVGNAVTQGILLGIISGLAIALVTLLNRSIVPHYPAFVIIFYQLGLMAALLLPLMLVMRPAVTAHDIGLLAVLGILFTAGAQMLFVQSLQSVPARLASLVNTGMEVVYGVTLAALLVPEIPSWRTLLGGAVIISATLYAIREHNSRELLLDPI
ncbi:DMT family transporter [bacterium]|nr:MAG: DMT family transporter [bacterium]